LPCAINPATHPQLTRRMKCCLGRIFRQLPSIYQSPAARVLPAQLRNGALNHLFRILQAIKNPKA